MRARDLMTSSVISVAPDTPIERIAALLLEHGISAVPVVEHDMPVGIISETDLVSRTGPQREPRKAWWLRALASPGPRPDPIAKINHALTARDVMSAPVVTADENTDIAEVVELMMDHNIKRLPILRAGKIVGLVSRADLLRALAKGLERGKLNPPSPFSRLFANIDKAYDKPDDAKPNPRPQSPPPHKAVLSAADFRSSMEQFYTHEQQLRLEHKHLMEKHHADEIEVVLGTHITEDMWRTLLINARVAAEHGENEFLALRIPRESCSDGGRAINVGEAGWPTTLRGEAAELWLRFQHDLAPQGFKLAARTMDYSGGVPGDIGFYLIWGAKHV